MSLELHGIDFLDRDDVGGRLAQVQPDLRVAVETKIARLSQTVTTLRAAGFSFVHLRTLADVARLLRLFGLFLGRSGRLLCLRATHRLVAA